MDAKPEHTNTTVAVSDGTSMGAYVARPGGKPIGGLIVLQEAFGVNAHIRHVTERFAGEGFLAIAPELFHRTGPGVEIAYGDFAAVQPHFKGLRDSTMELDLKAAYEWLRGNGATGNTPIASVGFCMGGRASFLAALSLPLRSAVCFYGGGIAPSQFFPGLLDRVPQLQAPVLLVWGGSDQHIDAAARNSVVEALRAAGKDFVNVEFSSAGHAFFCDARPNYNATAAAEAWPLTLAFLRTHSEQGAAA